ncbi:2-hydroxy-3-oxopropionate reductase [Nitrosomonas marina]|nr:2-hydroxy-3-oxopropionate reductase [Nitrosomonas marina]
MANIGFIGLGIMGKPMAWHLLQSEHTVYLHTRSGVPDDLVSSGGIACATPMELAQHADIIIMMLPDTPDVETVLFGDSGVVTGLLAESSQPVTRRVIIDMSTISPLATRTFASKINELNHDYVDAPVSGGDIGAQKAALTIMVGAEKEVFDRIKPVLELMGKQVTLIGGIGSGQICKIANQIIVSLTIEAVGEALLFVSRAGADPQKVRQALMGGFAGSRVLEVHGERMIERCFDPGFKIELQQKDLDIVLASASTLGIALPNTATVNALYNACIAHGGAKWDNSAIVKMLEKLANHEITKHND